MKRLRFGYVHLQGANVLHMRRKIVLAIKSSGITEPDRINLKKVGIKDWDHFYSAAFPKVSKPLCQSLWKKKTYSVICSKHLVKCVSNSQLISTNEFLVKSHVVSNSTKKKYTFIFTWADWTSVFLYIFPFRNWNLRLTDQLMQRSITECSELTSMYWVLSNIRQKEKWLVFYSDNFNASINAMERNDYLILPYFTDVWCAKTEVCNKSVRE